MEELHFQPQTIRRVVQTLKIDVIKKTGSFDSLTADLVLY